MLSESASLTTLDDKLKRLLVLEKSDTSLATLSGSDAAVNLARGSQNNRGPDNRQRRRGNQRRKDRDQQDPLPAPKPNDGDVPRAKVATSVAHNTTFAKSMAT